MKKSFLLWVIICLSSINLFAQSGIAKIKYGEAEKEYADGNYTGTLDKLAEAEKLFGQTNPPILYLRIAAQYKVLLSQRPKDLNLAASLTTNTKTYLTKYDGVAALEEKFKEVYDISEEVKCYGIDEATVKGAMAGLTNNMYSVGLFYTRTYNAGKALPWYTKCAEKGDVKAIHAVGEYYLDIEKWTLAIEWFKKADLKGYPPSTLQLADLYKDGYTVPKDTVKAKEYYLKAFNASKNKPEDADALSVLGSIYRHGLGFKNDDKIAFDYFKAAAEKGGDDWGAVANSYHRGYGVPRDHNLAIKYFNKVGERGEAYGYDRVAELYATGNRGVGKDLGLALKYYKKAYDVYSFPRSAITLGEFYANGKGVAVSYEKAMEYFNAVIELNDVNYSPGAMLYAGNMYAKEGPGQNCTEALKWYKKVATKPVEDYTSWLAMLNAGDLYAQPGSFQNLTEAINWYKMAADKNFKYAILRLIPIYKEGKGTIKNEALAAEWQKKYDALDK